MKAYTDLSQSKKLAEILPLDSADMRYAPFGDTHPWVWNEEVKLLEKGSVPCWSLAALLDVYPMCVGRDLGMYCCWVNLKSMCSGHFDNPVDACVDMILKLKERSLI